MMHYNRVEWALTEASKAIQSAMNSIIDTEQEKAALEKSLSLVRQAKEECRAAQAETIVHNMFHGPSM